jgi:hypothetical protein
MFNKFIKIAAAMVIFASIAFNISLFNLSANAAGVNLAITPSTAAVSSTGSISISYTSTVAQPPSGSIFFIYPSTYTGVITTANITVNGTAPTAAVVTTSAGQTQVQMTMAAAVPTGTVTVATSALTKPSVAGNYSFTVYSTSGDYGAVLQYIGDANVVQVTAFVPLNLSFVIRNAADTANTNICDMGRLITTTVGSCSYRLKIGTNAGNGYTVNVKTSGNFTNGSVSMNNAAAGAAGSSIPAGVELYGVFANAGQITSTANSITLATPFSTTAGKVVNFVHTTTDLLATATDTNAPSATDTTNTILMEHKAAIDASTGAGLYNQTVTYTVVANF